eukprot:4340474-Pyramimonas_sp.AAC.1
MRQSQMWRLQNCLQSAPFLRGAAGIALAKPSCFEVSRTLLEAAARRARAKNLNASEMELTVARRDLPLRARGGLAVVARPGARHDARMCRGEF